MNCLRTFSLRISEKKPHHTTSKMAQMQPYNFLHHDRFWPLLGQNYLLKFFHQTKILARTLRTILMSAVVLHNCLIACGHPYQTGNVFCHQIIISMDIDDDMMM
jgi:hypothetical protein